MPIYRHVITIESPLPDLGPGTRVVMDAQDKAVADFVAAHADAPFTVTAGPGTQVRVRVETRPRKRKEAVEAPVEAGDPAADDDKEFGAAHGEQAAE
jgi:hypothetical protein